METFTKIADITTPNPPAHNYTYKTDSYMGCYYVTATNKYGTEKCT